MKLPHLPLKTARPSRGSDDHVKRGRKNSVSN